MELNSINQLNSKDFLNKFSNIIENSSEIAEFLNNRRPFTSFQSIFDSINEYFSCLTEIAIPSINRNLFKEKIKIFQKYPRLSSNLEGLTSNSRKEHQLGGLNNLDINKNEQLQYLNMKFEKIFNFPFIICIQESNFDNLFNILEQSVQNPIDYSKQIERTLKEVLKIAKNRFESIIFC